jgi:TolB-like protein
MNSLIQHQTGRLHGQQTVRETFAGGSSPGRFILKSLFLIMPALLPGYEYDVFISYRQKDNKYDGWVTEFVANLKKELEATVKDDLSIYFDENPHDGLHDHHDVDDSLKDKLKCLVFVPILSRTYCDPRSFAWEHEFRAFLSQASADRLGLKVKLPNGNVTGRILPVRIHELGQEDVRLFEAETQSVLRPIDFIFKASGVNRALLRDDRKDENSNHTSYRDQINRAANAIGEIVSAIAHPAQPLASTAAESVAPPSAAPSRRKQKMLAFASTAALLAVAAVYLLFFSERKLKDPSTAGVAVLPFRNNTGSEELNYYGIGMASEIRTRLSMSKEFSFVSSLQATLPYANTEKSPKQIGDELDVDFILSGLYQAAGGKIKVEAELVDAESGQVVWSVPYEGELEDVFQLQSSIAHWVLSRFSKGGVDAKGPESTTSLEAYAYYIRGNMLNENPPDSVELNAALSPAIQQYEKAIAADSSYVDAWVKLIDTEGFVVLNEPNNLNFRERVVRHYSYFNKHFSDTWQSDLVRGIYAYRVEHEYETALESLQKVLDAYPDNLTAIQISSYIHKRRLNFAESIRLKKRVFTLNPGSSGEWKDLGDVLWLMGDPGSASQAYLKAFELLPTIDHAQYSIWSSFIGNQPVDGLPEGIRRKVDFSLEKGVQNRDWEGVKAIAFARKEEMGEAAFYLWICRTYQMLGKEDSMRYWARKGIEIMGSQAIDRLYAFAGNKVQAFEELNKYFSPLIETGDDKMSQAGKLSSEIDLYVNLGDYESATQTLKRLNRELPDWGGWGYLENSAWYDRIKQEYPPFREALSSVKRKPVLDVQEIIKF